MSWVPIPVKYTFLIGWKWALLMLKVIVKTHYGFFMCTSSWKPQSIYFYLMFRLIWMRWTPVPTRSQIHIIHVLDWKKIQLNPMTKASIVNQVLLFTKSYPVRLTHPQFVCVLLFVAHTSSGSRTTKCASLGGSGWTFIGLFINSFCIVTCGIFE